MATITTTTVTTPLIWPSTTLIDRSPVTGHLWAMVKASTANTFQLWRSTDKGATWGLVTSQVRASVQEISSIHIPSDGHIHWTFRTYESGQDRIYAQRIYVSGSTILWGTQVLLAAATAGAAGAVYTGMDLASASVTGMRLIAVAVGTTSGSRTGVTMLGLTIDDNDVPRATLAMFGGTRWWNQTGAGRITPSLEIEHGGDGKTGYPAHLWVVWGRTDVYVAKMAWSGGRWIGPTAPVKVNPATLTPAQDQMVGRWDGDRMVIAYPDPVATSTARVIERDRSNTKTTQRQTPVHPTGVVRNCAVGYDSEDGDLRVYAVGTSTTVLYFVDFVRATGLWTTWAAVSATAILGATGNNYSVRRATTGNARFDVLTAHATPTPNTLVHTAQAITYTPNPPTWNVPGIGYNNGAAADVNAALPLDWVFSDADPDDDQSAWALSRQIGAGTIAYLRASDSTWQATEQKNVGATTIRSLASGWGLDADAAHSYKAKVWDLADVASAYSDAFVVIPSVKANPTVTAPVAAAVITEDTVTATWTVTQQTAYRVTLATNPGAAIVYDSGWRASTATTLTVPYRMADGTGWTITVQTRNTEGLASNVVSVNFTVDYLEPAIPTTVATPIPASGIIRVVVTNPAPSGGQPALTDQDLYRRVVGATDDGDLLVVGLASGATYDDWRAVSGVAYEYRVQARGLNGTSVFGAWTP